MTDPDKPTVVTVKGIPEKIEVTNEPGCGWYFLVVLAVALWRSSCFL